MLSGITLQLLDEYAGSAYKGDLFVREPERQEISVLPTALWGYKMREGEMMMERCWKRFSAGLCLGGVVMLALFAFVLFLPAPVAAEQEGMVEGREWVGPLTYNISGAVMGPRAVDQHNLHRYDKGEFSTAGTTIDVWGVAHNVATELAGSANYSNGDMGLRGYIRYKDSRGYDHMIADTGTIRYPPGTKYEYKMTAVIPPGARSVSIVINNGAYWSTSSYTMLAASFSPVQVAPAPAPPVQPATAIRINIDGKPLQAEVPPIIFEGRTLVPLRAIFEALGMDVEYITSTMTIIGTKGNSRIQLTVNSTRATVNGKAATLDVPATVINGRTLVPVRFIAESTGQSVVWDGVTRTVSITTK